MGWSATIKDKLRTNDNAPYFVVGKFTQYSKTYSLFLFKDEILTFDEGYINESFEITGYLYAGELAGDEPIPKGVFFTIKDDCKVWLSEKDNGVLLDVFRWEEKDGKDIKNRRTFSKLLLEPYFE